MCTKQAFPIIMCTKQAHTKLSVPTNLGYANLSAHDLGIYALYSKDAGTKGMHNDPWCS